MNDREVKRYEMCNRVVTFGQDHAADFAASSKATELFGKLKLAIKQADEARPLQQGGRATAREVLLDGLRIDLKNIVRTAREIGEEVPGFADRFSLPVSPSHAELLTAANRAMIELKKTEVAAQFAGYELPETFVDDLEADLKAIDESKYEQDGTDLKGVASTVVLGAAIRSGLQIVGKLNAIMHNKYTREPEKLRAWKSASHTERAARREKATPGANGSTPTTPVAAAGAA